MCALPWTARATRRRLSGGSFAPFTPSRVRAQWSDLGRVASFTHHVETLLDRVREGKVAASPRIAELVLASADEIKRLLAVEPDSVPLASEGREAPDCGA